MATPQGKPAPGRSDDEARREISPRPTAAAPPRPEPSPDAEQVRHCKTQLSYPSIQVSHQPPKLLDACPKEVQELLLVLWVLTTCFGVALIDFVIRFDGEPDLELARDGGVAGKAPKLTPHVAKELAAVLTAKQDKHPARHVTVVVTLNSAAPGVTMAMNAHGLPALFDEATLLQRSHQATAKYRERSPNCLIFTAHVRKPPKLFAEHIDTVQKWYWQSAQRPQFARFRDKDITGRLLEAFAPERQHEAWTAEQWADLSARKTLRMDLRRARRISLEDLLASWGMGPTDPEEAGPVAVFAADDYQWHLTVPNEEILAP